jgi:DNA-binding transcriptional ArsR family regulator
LEERIGVSPPTAVAFGALGCSGDGPSRPEVKAIERHASELAALGHAARLSILLALVQAGPEGVTTTDLQEHLGIPWTTLNHHLERLVDAGLVVARREGKSVFHTTDYEAVRALNAYLWEDCCKHGGNTSKGPR